MPANILTKVVGPGKMIPIYVSALVLFGLRTVVMNLVLIILPYKNRLSSSVSSLLHSPSQRHSEQHLVSVSSLGEFKNVKLVNDPFS